MVPTVIGRTKSGVNNPPGLLTRFLFMVHKMKFYVAVALLSSCLIGSIFVTHGGGMQDYLISEGKLIEHSLGPAPIEIDIYVNSQTSNVRKAKSPALRSKVAPTESEQKAPRRAVELEEEVNEGEEVEEKVVEEPKGVAFHLFGKSFHLSVDNDSKQDHAPPAVEEKEDETKPKTSRTLAHPSSKISESTKELKTPSFQAQSVPEKLAVQVKRTGKVKVLDNTFMVPKVEVSKVSSIKQAAFKPASKISESTKELRQPRPAIQRKVISTVAASLPEEEEGIDSTEDNQEESTVDTDEEGEEGGEEEQAEEEQEEQQKEEGGELTEEEEGEAEEEQEEQQQEDGGELTEEEEGEAEEEQEEEQQEEGGELTEEEEGDDSSGTDFIPPVQEPPVETEPQAKVNPVVAIAKTALGLQKKPSEPISEDSGAEEEQQPDSSEDQVQEAVEIALKAEPAVKAVQAAKPAVKAVQAPKLVAAKPVAKTVQASKPVVAKPVVAKPAAKAVLAKPAVKTVQASKPNIATPAVVRKAAVPKSTLAIVPQSSQKAPEVKPQAVTTSEIKTAVKQVTSPKRLPPMTRAIERALDQDVQTRSKPVVPRKTSVGPSPTVASAKRAHDKPLTDQRAEEKDLEQSMLGFLSKIVDPIARKRIKNTLADELNKSSTNPEIPTKEAETSKRPPARIAAEAQQSTTKVVASSTKSATAAANVARPALVKVSSPAAKAEVIPKSFTQAVIKAKPQYLEEERSPASDVKKPTTPTEVKTPNVPEQPNVTDGKEKEKLKEKVAEKSRDLEQESEKDAMWKHLREAIKFDMATEVDTPEPKPDPKAPALKFSDSINIQQRSPSFRPVFAWENKYDVVHIVETDFLQYQLDLVHLNQARMDLFKTFTLPSMQQQSSQEYLWLIWTDPGLPDNFKIQLLDLVKDMPNAVVLGYRRDTGLDFRELNGLTVNGLGKALWTGNRELFMNYFEASMDRVLLETRLDADDALNKDFIESVQRQTIKSIAKSEIETDYRIFCPEHHTEWRYFKPKNEAFEQGHLVAYHNERFCINSGLTVGYQPKAKTRHLNTVEQCEFSNLHEQCQDDPSKAGRSHYCITRMRILGDGTDQAVLMARTPTSAGMKRVLGTEETFKETFESVVAQKEAWSMVGESFGVMQQEVKDLRLKMQDNIRSILQDALEGQCMPGHSCKAVTKRKLVKLLNHVKQQSGNN